MRLGVTIGVLLLVALWSFRRGGGPERATAVTMLCALTVGLIHRLFFGNAKYDEFHTMLFGIEIAVLISFGSISLMANRIWPLWISSLQLLLVSSHVAKLLGVEGRAGAYWIMATIPTYLQIMVLMIGIFAHSRRVSRIGLYPDWRRF